MLPAALTAMALKLCAAASAPLAATPLSFAIEVRSGATLHRQPDTRGDAEATVRELVALGADFVAGPLAISGGDFATFGVTPANVFDACALANLGTPVSTMSSQPRSLADLAILLRQAFGARITDTVRPANATYGARYSWHKSAQAIDFVPAGGVGAIDRTQIRDLMAEHGFRLIELFGPGDRGHADHWHVAFARPGQVIDRPQASGDRDDWVIVVAADQASSATNLDALASRSAAPTRIADAQPASWDVFATTDERPLWTAGS